MFIKNLYPGPQDMNIGNSKISEHAWLPKTITSSEGAMLVGCASSTDSTNAPVTNLKPFLLYKLYVYFLEPHSKSIAFSLNLKKHYNTFMASNAGFKMCDI